LFILGYLFYIHFT